MTKVKQSRVAVSAVGFLSLTASVAAEPAITFEGKQVVMMVGSSAGGGYDTFSRTIAPHFAKHLPGQPSIIIQNMPGAGSLKLTNHLYNIAPKDGTVFGAVNPNVVTLPLLDPKQVKFDARKFAWLGSALRETGVAVAWHTAPVQSFDDLFQKELIVAGTGGGTIIYPTFLNSLIGTKFKLVQGYRGLKEGMLAMERGEVAGTGNITWASLKATNGEWLKDRKLRVLAQYGPSRHADLPDVPWVFDYARTDEQRTAMNLVFNRQEYGRPYVAPPGLPVSVVTVLRRAFDATMKDPRFLEDAKQRGLDVDPITGEEMDALIARMYETPPAIVERVKAIFVSDK